MAYNGGIYGDYEVAKSTRVLEKRRYAEEIYNTRVFNAKGGSMNYFNSFLFFGISYLMSKQYLRNHINNNYLFLAGSAAVGALAFTVGPCFFGDSETLYYLKSNKSDIVKNIDRCLLEDHKERQGIYPVLKKEESVESVEVTEQAEQSENDS
jgi:hypothetical protein